MVDDQHGKISKKAYEIWDSHGRPHGKDAEHWAAAVKAVEAESAAPAKKPRAKAAKVGIPESAKTTPVATEAERHVELAAASDTEMPKPKRGKAKDPVDATEKKPRAAKKA